MDKDKLYKAGDRVGPYEILDPLGHGGVLPTAVIVEGSNTGIKVIMTRTGRVS